MTIAKSLAVATIVVGCFAAVAIAQPRQRQPFVAGQPVGVELDGEYTPLSDNAAVFGGLVNAHSCVVDAARGLVIVPSQGYGQNLVPNDAYVSLLNPDGSVDTLKWIGINRNGGLVLNDPTSIAISGDTLYIADIDGGTRSNDGGQNRPTTAVIRMFDLATGTPTGGITIDESPGLQGIAAAPDGTIYAAQSGPGGAYPPPESQRVYRIAPDGSWSVFLEGEPLTGPSSVAVDPDGNVVVINNRNDDVMTFSPDGELLATEDADALGAQSGVLVPGNVGLAIAADGTKYVSNTRTGVVTRLSQGEPTETIASGVQGASAICLDPARDQLFVALGTGNAVAIVSLE